MYIFLIVAFFIVVYTVQADEIVMEQISLDTSTSTLPMEDVYLLPDTISSTPQSIYSTDPLITELSIVEVPSSTQPEMAATTADITFVSSTPATTTEEIITRNEVIIVSSSLEVSSSIEVISNTPSLSDDAPAPELPTPDVSLEVARQFLAPWSNVTVLGIKSIVRQYVALLVAENKNTMVVLYNLSKPDSPGTIVAAGASAPLAPTMAVKEHMLLWQRGTAVYAFNTQDLALNSKTIPSEEPKNLRFESLNFDVIVREDGIVFNSPETGEVFADEDSEALQRFADEHPDALVLRHDDFVQLHLIIDAEEESVE